MPLKSYFEILLCAVGTPIVQNPNWRQDRTQIRNVKIYCACTQPKTRIFPYSTSSHLLFIHFILNINELFLFVIVDNRYRQIMRLNKSSANQLVYFSLWAVHTSAEKNSKRAFYYVVKGRANLNRTEFF